MRDGAMLLGLAGALLIAAILGFLQVWLRSSSGLRWGDATALLCAGTLVLAGTGWFVWGDFRLLARGEVVEARVVSVVENSDRCRFNFQFRDARGRDRSTSRRLSCSHTSDLKEGTTVHIYYDPLDDHLVKPWPELVADGPSLAAALVFALLLYGLAWAQMRFQMRRRARRAQRAFGSLGGPGRT